MRVFLQDWSGHGLNSCKGRIRNDYDISKNIAGICKLVLLYTQLSLQDAPNVVPSIRQIQNLPILADVELPILPDTELPILALQKSPVPQFTE